MLRKTLSYFRREINIDSTSRTIHHRDLKKVHRNIGTKMIDVASHNRIIWMDLEMTGLDFKKDVIMEIGCIVTGPHLEEIARHPEIIINVSEEVLNNMPSWCVDTHGSSGLTEACRNSLVTILEAENQLLTFLQTHTEPSVCPLGGNSIWVDRLFIQKFMPRINDHLHYRCIDVSSIKELVRRWYPEQREEQPKKRFVHKTIADIEDSINELKFYREKVFIP